MHNNVLKNFLIKCFKNNLEGQYRQHAPHGSVDVAYTLSVRGSSIRSQDKVISPSETALKYFRKSRTFLSQIIIQAFFGSELKSVILM